MYIKSHRTVMDKSRHNIACYSTPIQNILPTVHSSSTLRVPEQALGLISLLQLLLVFVSQLHMNRSYEESELIGAKYKLCFLTKEIIQIVQ